MCLKNCNFAVFLKHTIIIRLTIIWVFKITFLIENQVNHLVLTNK